MPRYPGFPHQLLILGSLALCLVAPAAVSPATAQERPAYTQLSDEATLKMSLQDFQYRYGRDATGAEADALIIHYAQCLSRRNDQTARRLAVAGQATLLRARLAEFDTHKFTPSMAYFGGTLERGHYDASTFYEREQALQQLIPLVTRKRRGTSAGEREARTTFKKWLKEIVREVTPPAEELEGKDAAERADIRARYTLWSTRLQEKARAIEALAITLPAPAAEVFLLYACSR